MTYAIESTGLKKSYKRAEAVRGIDLAVPEGSIYGFLGPNGAGKTTTIKMLTGLTKPTSGSIRICGREMIFGRNDPAGLIGFLPDVPGFYRWMTAPQFMRLCGSLLGLDRAASASASSELLELVGLAGVKKQIGSYSRGMKQRLGIAQALIGNPKVVFMDEPTSALDPVGRREILDLIRKLAGRTTIFLSTHILSDVERVCDRFAILDNGLIVEERSMDSLAGTRPTLELLVDCGTGDPAAFAAELMAKCIAKSIETLPDGAFKFRPADPAEAYKAIPKLIADRGYALRRLIEAEASLEDLFMEVVSR